LLDRSHHERKSEPRDLKVGSDPIDATSYCGKPRAEISEQDFIDKSHKQSIEEFCDKNSVSIAFSLICHSNPKTTMKADRRAFDPIYAKAIISPIIYPEGQDSNTFPYGHVGYWDMKETPKLLGVVIDEERLDRHFDDECRGLGGVPTPTSQFQSRITYVKIDCFEKIQSYKDRFAVAGYSIHAMFKNGKHLFENNYEKAELLSNLNEKICRGPCGKMIQRGPHLLTDEADTVAMIQQGDFLLSHVPVKGSTTFFVDAIGPLPDAPLLWFGFVWEGDTDSDATKNLRPITFNKKEHMDRKKDLHGWANSQGKFISHSAEGRKKALVGENIVQKQPAQLENKEISVPEKTENKKVTDNQIPDLDVKEDGKVNEIKSMTMKIPFGYLKK
jgi:hypothetical protein